MGDDLREAAERMRAYFRWREAHPDWNGEPLPDCPYYPIGDRVWDGDALAHAYILDHPADDAEPVTEEWLRSVGFHDSRYQGKRFSLQLGDVRVCPPIADLGLWVGIMEDDGDFYSGAKAIPQSHIRTRGDVRRLCAALGITLPGVRSAG